MSIRLSLLLSCLALLVLTIGLGLFARRWQHQLGTSAIEIYDGSNIGLRFITDVQTGLNRFAAGHTVNPTSGADENTRAVLRGLTARLEVAIERAMTGQARADGRVLAIELDALSHETDPRAFTTRLAHIDAGLTRLVGRFGADGLAARDSVEALVARGDEVLLSVLTGVVLLSFAIAVALGWSVIPPLHRAVAVAGAIADGKLDTPIPLMGKSETAHLMRALDRMQEAIRTHLEEIDVRHAAEAKLRERVLRAEADEARERQRAAEEAAKARSTFLAMMSHEIRTPMNAVLGLTSTLMHEEMTASQLDAVRAIHGAGDSLMRILNDILDFSRLDAGRMTFEVTPFSPATLTEETLSVHGPTAREKGIYLKVVREHGLPARTLGDAGRIAQILHNLVSNALKFTRAGGVTVHARCVNRGGDDATIEWTVTDTGIGISEESLGKLFDAFVQADNSISRRFGGSGLGLAICKQLASLMGGTISATSTPGQGSEFRVSLPLKLTVDPSDRQAAAKPDDSLARRLANEGRRLKLLLAEDNETNQFVFTRMLNGTAIDVDIANNGTEAVEAARRTRYDLICMDVSMPEMDGLEATRIIRRETGPCQDVPIVALTANAFAEDMEACTAAGMTGFVAKPIKKQTLFGAILDTMPPPPNADAAHLAA